MTESLDVALKIVGAVQIGVAGVNLGLVRILNWREDLERLPLLAREVFHVHLWFISLTLALFGVLSCRFATEMAARENAALVWLATGIGGFWAIRCVIQVSYYSSKHWRGNALRTAIHVGCSLVYGAMATVYLLVSGASLPS